MSPSRNLARPDAAQMRDDSQRCAMERKCSQSRGSCQIQAGQASVVKGNRRFFGSGRPLVRSAVAQDDNFERGEGAENPRQVSDRMSSCNWGSCYPTLSPEERAKGWGTGRFFFERSGPTCAGCSPAGRT